MVPPEGLVGTNNYNVCVDYAYSYYMSSGQGARAERLCDRSPTRWGAPTPWDSRRAGVSGGRHQRAGARARQLPGVSRRRCMLCAVS